MAWVRLEDGFPEHPKVVRAGGMASWLFVCGLTYANRRLTDGHIPTEMVPRLTDFKNPMALATRLVDVGLWEKVEGGFQIHDYLDYQPSAERVTTERAATATRVAALRSRRNGSSNEGVAPLPRPSNTRTSALHHQLEEEVEEEPGSRGPETKNFQPPGGSAAVVATAAADPPAGLFFSARWEPTAAQLAKLRQIAERRGLDLELEAMKITDWLASPKARHGSKRQECSFRFVAGWLEREQSNGSNGHGENRQRPGGVGQGPRRANVGAGGGAAGEVDPFAKYVRSDEFPNGRADGP